VFKIRKIVWKNYVPLQAQINSFVLNNVFQISSKSTTYNIHNKIVPGYRKESTIQTVEHSVGEIPPNVQQACHIHRSVLHGFPYSQRNECGSPCALHCSSLDYSSLCWHCNTQRISDHISVAIYHTTNDPATQLSTFIESNDSTLYLGMHGDMV